VKTKPRRVRVAPTDQPYEEPKAPIDPFFSPPDPFVVGKDSEGGSTSRRRQSRPGSDVASFNPPSYIEHAWDEAGEPIRFVTLRECTGRALAEAIRRAGPERIESLQHLRTLFIRNGGHDNATIGDVLRLPPLARPPRTKFARYIPDDRRELGMSDWEFRKRHPLS